ncbi:unnamed protein product [Urochloa humidicola]
MSAEGRATRIGEATRSSSSFILLWQHTHLPGNPRAKQGGRVAVLAAQRARSTPATVRPSQGLRIHTASGTESTTCLKFMQISATAEQEC